MNKNELLIKYDSAVESLIEIVNTTTIEERCFIPKKVDDWSINEHLLHIAFSESESFARCLLMDTCKKEIIKCNDSRSWIKNIVTNTISAKNVIDYLSNQKTLIISIVKNEEESVFLEKYVTCFYNNEEITVSLYENIESSIMHIEFHMNYINQIKSEYHDELRQ